LLLRSTIPTVCYTLKLSISGTPTFMVLANVTVSMDDKKLAAYVAGAFDWGSAFRLRVRKSDQYAIGYTVEPQIQFRKKDESVLYPAYCAALCQPREQQRGVEANHLVLVDEAREHTDRDKVKYDRDCFDQLWYDGDLK